LLVSDVLFLGMEEHHYRHHLGVSCWQMEIFHYCQKETVREAQIPLRNRASAMHFFVATFYRRNDLLLHLSPLKSTSSKFVTHTANKLHATAARAHDARPHRRLMSPF